MCIYVFDQEVKAHTYVYIFGQEMEVRIYTWPEKWKHIHIFDQRNEERTYTYIWPAKWNVHIFDRLNTCLLKLATFSQAWVFPNLSKE
jgi:hypothetical protein